MDKKIYFNGNEVSSNAIKSFSGKWFFLSNFYRCTVPYNGIEYKSSEAAFQAQKTLDDQERLKFVNVTPSESKHLGRSVKLRSDWEEVKDNIMFDIVKSKFDNNSDLKIELLETGDRDLFEGNTWNDKYWGVVHTENELIGKNNLGKILMKLREEYQNTGSVIIGKCRDEELHEEAHEAGPIVKNKTKEQVQQECKYGDVFTTEEFWMHVEYGSFNEYDGTGYYHDGENETDLSVWNYPNKKGMPYVCWYNK